MVAELQNEVEVEVRRVAGEITTYRLEIRAFAERAEYYTNEATTADMRAENCRKSGSVVAEDGFRSHARNCRKSASNEIRAWGVKILDFAIAYPEHPSIVDYLLELRNRLNVAL